MYIFKWFKCLWHCALPIFMHKVTVYTYQKFLTESSNLISGDLTVFPFIYYIKKESLSQLWYDLAAGCTFIHSLF